MVRPLRIYSFSMLFNVSAIECQRLQYIYRYKPPQMPCHVSRFDTGRAITSYYMFLLAFTMTCMEMYCYESGYRLGAKEMGEED